MAYERSEPIAESFGELDVNIDFRLADYLEENKTEEGWRGFHRIEKNYVGTKIQLKVLKNTQNN